MSTLQPEPRVRLPDGRYGTVKYHFSEYPFKGDACVAVDGREERERRLREAAGDTAVGLRMLEGLHWKDFTESERRDAIKNHAAVLDAALGETEGE